MSTPTRIQRQRTKDPRRGTDRLCYGCAEVRAVSGQNGFCGPRCRFLARVDRSKGQAECWTWMGPPLNERGYGRFWANGKRFVAHRYAHELMTGSIPDGYEVDHLCRNTSCVNPAHLEAVTPEEHDRRTPHGAFQQARTHCPKGHQYSVANTRRDSRGSRHCRACNRIKNGGESHA